MQDEQQSKNKETKALSHDEQQELINKSEQVLANFQKLDSEIKFSARDFQNQFNSISDTLTEWSNVQESLNSRLEKNLSILTKETTILTALPDKVGRQLTHLIPNIATEIQKKTFENFHAELDLCNKAVDQLSDKIQMTTKKLLEVKQNAFNKKLINCVLVLSITIISSTALTYAIMRLFPTKVNIDTKGDITIDGSNVSIWGTGKNTVQPSKKTKNY